jgi:hypothetical protein
MFGYETCDFSIFFTKSDRLIYFGSKMNHSDTMRILIGDKLKFPSSHRQLGPEKKHMGPMGI